MTPGLACVRGTKGFDFLVRFKTSLFHDGECFLLSCAGFPEAHSGVHQSRAIARGSTRVAKVARPIPNTIASRTVEVVFITIRL